MENVIISNPSEFARKKAALKAGGAQNLHIVADFDGTLTKAYVNGEKRHSLVETIRKYKYLPDDYVTKAYALFDKYYPMEHDATLDSAVKRAKMEEWWSSHVKVMSEYGMSEDVIARVVENSPLPIREGMSTFLDTLHAHQIPFMILSASITDLIEGSMAHANLLRPNIHIFSNQYAYDANGKVTGYLGKIIHSLNKDETVIKGTKYEQIIQHRKNVILLGDSLSDVGMLAGFKHDTVIKIGFLNDQVEKKLPAHKEAYDVIILNDGSMDFVNELMKGVL